MREMRQRDEGWQMQLFHSKGDGQRGTVHGQSDKQCERGPTPDQTVNKLWRCLQHLENQLDWDRPAQAQEDQMCARLSKDEPKETVDSSKITKLFFANVTAWGDLTQEFLTCLGNNVIMGVVEHSLGDRKLKATVRKLLQRGWKAYASPSLTVGRPVGGAALLVNDKLAESFTGFAHGNGYSFASCFVRLEDYEVLVVAMYLKSGEDLESPTNSELLKELTCLLRTVSTPWMAMADWNRHPERLKEHWFLEAVKGEMVLTGEATISTGNQLDYLVVSKHLHGWVGTAVDMEVPRSPHYGIQICLRQGLRQFEFPVMNRFKVIPACLGPRLPRRCFYRPHMSIMLPGQVHEGNHEETLDQKFADFVAQFEMWKYSTVTDVDEEDLGRG